MASTESVQLSIASSLYPAIPASHDIGRESHLISGNGDLKEWDYVKYPDAECGKTKFAIKCKDEYQCDYPFDLIPWDCTRLLCPVCYKRALTRAANKATDHVWSTLSELKSAIPEIGWRISSVIISVPRELWHLEFDDLKKKFRRSLKHLGTENVAAILHLWRFRNTATGEETESVPWKEYKENPGLYEKVVQPHFHCFVIGKMVKSPKYFQDSGGWVYKKKRSKHGALNRKDVFRISHYALSHASISTTRKRQYVAYYGLFHSIGVIEKTTTLEPVICPKCNNQRVIRTEFHNWIAGVDYYGLEEPAVKAIVHRKWAFRGKWQRWVGGLKSRDLDCGLDFSGVEAPTKAIDYVEFDDV